jgi:hypothetical protein
MRFGIEKISFKKIINLFLNHLYIVLLVPLFFIAYQLLLVPGISIGNGDLPYLDTLYGFKKLWMWVDHGSYHNLEFLPRFPITGLFVIVQLLGVSSDVISKLLIILGFFVASFSFYFSCVLFFKTRINTQDLKFKIGAIFGSLFYAYNVWSIHRIGHWYFWIGYGLLPIFFVSSFYALRYPKKMYYAFACVLLWSVASSTPHMAIFYGLIFVTLSVILLIKNYGNRFAIISLLKPIFLILIVYPFINFYWIYPYVNSSTSETFLWNSVNTEETTEGLSRESSFPNLIRLIEGTFNMGTINVIPQSTSALYPFWVFVGFVPAIIAFLSVLFNKSIKIKRDILFFLGAVLIGIFLSLGTNAPFNFYSTVLFSNYLISTLQILFREPDKWGFLVAFGYSFLIAISSFLILSKFQKFRYSREISISFVVFVLASITIYFYPALSDSLKNLYHPVILPVDFSRLDTILRTLPNNSKLFFMPYSPETTIWGGDKGTLNFYPLASLLSNIAPSDFNTLERYHNFLVNSILDNKTNNINNALYPLGASYLVYHNDTLIPTNEQLLNRLLRFEGMQLIKNAGFLELFKVGKEKKNEVNIPINNALVVGGLNVFNSVNSIHSFDSLNTSLYFLDQKIKNAKDKFAINNSQYLFASRDVNDFIFSVVDNNRIMAPFNATNHHNPEKLWSKAGVNDPGNAWFNPYLKELGMDNSDFDYGKGLVITKAIGTNLTIPIDVNDANEYTLYARYLKNQKGGIMNVYLDGKLIRELHTKENKSSTFVWNMLDPSVNLTKGRHVLILENVFGFNALNIFAVMPKAELTNLTERGYSIANKLGNIIHILEAESNFVNVKGINKSAHKLYSDNLKNGTFSKTYSGQFKTPQMADLLSIELLAKKQTDLNSSYSIKNIEIKSAEKEPAIFYDFENQSKPISISNKDWINNDQKIFIDYFENQSKPISISNKDWISNDQKILNLSSTVNKSTSGNNSLKVDVGQGNSTNWSIISTDFLPAKEDTYYNYSLNVSARDVNQLHSKVIYYDSKKKEIGSDFIFTGRDGAFNNNIVNILNIPHNTKHIKFQMWVHPNPLEKSYYFVSGTTITATALKEAWKNYNSDMQNISIGKFETKAGNNSLKVDVGQGNSTNWSIISTDFLPAKEDTYYNYSLNVSARDVNQLHSKVIYYDSKKKEIGSDFIFTGRDGTFNNNIKESFIPIEGTKYLRFEILAHPNSPYSGTSTYWIDNMKLEEFIPTPSRIVFRNDFPNFKSVNNTDQKIAIVDDSNSTYLRDDLLNGSAEDYKRIATIPFPVKENEIYNYAMTIELNNISSLTALASFRNSSDVVENMSKYGTNASNGRIVTLYPGSEIFTTLDILKSANYTIAFRTNTCNVCTPLILTILDDQNNIIKTYDISSNHHTDQNSNTDQNSTSTSQLGWNYNSTFLKKGKYGLKINTDSQRDLDSIIVYSTTDQNNTYNSFDDRGGEYRITHDLFNRNMVSSIPSISDYKKINPTKYVIGIKNATKPFLMSFAESYDPLWRAYSAADTVNNASNFMTNSIPLYSTINGFYINKTGDYTLNIEYEPQVWFVQGGIISVITMIAISILYIIGHIQGAVHWKKFKS